jgi:nucleolar protein 16
VLQEKAKMGRERQKFKNRSSVTKSRPKDNRTKAGKKKINFLGNETIAKNWWASRHVLARNIPRGQGWRLPRNRKQTLSQNYQRLGLSSKLSASTGGTEKKKPGQQGDAAKSKRDSLAIAGPRATTLQANEVQVERDPATGRIIRVLGSESNNENDNPLNDPLNDLDESDAEDVDPPEAKTGIIAQLEAEAAAEEQSLAKKQPRQQSQREEEWIARLIEKHGDNIKAMVRDKKLNPMQQTEGDIGRRIKKWKAKHPTWWQLRNGKSSSTFTLVRSLSSSTFR